jgi:hypothetical protein
MKSPPSSTLLNHRQDDKTMAGLRAAFGGV